MTGTALGTDLIGTMKKGQTHVQPERKELASQWLVTKRLSSGQLLRGHKLQIVTLESYIP